MRNRNLFEYLWKQPFCWEVESSVGNGRLWGYSCVGLGSWVRNGRLGWGESWGGRRPFGLDERGGGERPFGV